MALDFGFPVTAGRGRGFGLAQPAVRDDRRLGKNRSGEGIVSIGDLVKWIIQAKSVTIHEVPRAGVQVPGGSFLGKSGVGWPMRWPWGRPPQAAAESRFGASFRPSWA